LRVRAVNKPQYDENEKSSISEHNNIEGITFENKQVYYENYRDNDDDDDEDQLLPQILQVDDDDDDDIDDDDDDDQLPYKPLLGTLQVNDDDNDKPLFDNTEDILEEESSDFRGFDGEYNLYFPNFTSAMLFVWIIKHMICE
ncbi:hypothetical protein C1645_816472, partial [Glomus cerebriforme]